MVEHRKHTKLIFKGPSMTVAVIYLYLKKMRNWEGR